MGVRQRARMRAAGDQPGEMRHVDHEIGADLVGDLAEARKINDARIGRPTGDDELGLFRLGELLDLIEIDPPVVAPDAVLHGVEPFARKIGRRAVGQVPARGERHAHDRVARLQQRQQHRLVGLRAGMGLHVGEGAAEQPLGAVDGELLDDIDKFAAAVIALAGIALGIFVGQDRALRLEHGARDDVLGRDELDLVLLPRQLVGDGSGEFGIGVGDRGAEEAVGGT